MKDKKEFIKDKLNEYKLPLLISLLLIIVIVFGLGIDSFNNVWDFVISLVIASSPTAVILIYMLIKLFKK